MAKLTATLAILAVLGLAACGDDEDETATDSVPAAEQAADAGGGDDEGSESDATGAKGDGDTASGAGDGAGSRPGIEITTAGSQYGEILFDSDRRAIYLFDKESGPTSECYGACAAAWPPVVTEGEPRAAGAVEQRLLGTTERDDGTTQVTYAGHPLYYYVDDPAGQVLCHNVEEFGGLWLVVEPSGEAVQ